MIITKLQGGLGNQMFQYAIGRHLASENKTELKLDKTFFDKTKNKKSLNRKYELNFFNILGNFATQEEIKKLEKYKRKTGWKYLIHNLLFVNKLIYIEENNFNFDQIIFKTTNNVYLNGYWQSEKYFKDIENTIREEFTLKDKFQIKNTPLKETIENTNSVSLHIRRGDYIDNKKTNEIHGTCSLEYYQKAVQKISKKNKDLHIFIFSDDIPWAKNNLKINLPVAFIDGNKDYEDLILMSLCKHNIIANSSFSWWGAWLNKNPKKIVVAPKKWFNKSNINTRDLIPRSWIKI